MWSDKEYESLLYDNYVLRDERDRLRAEVERLKEQLDEWQSMAKDHAENSANATSDVIDLRAEVEGLRKTIAVLDDECRTDHYEALEQCIKDQEELRADLADAVGLLRDTIDSMENCGYGENHTTELDAARAFLTRREVTQ